MQSCTGARPPQALTEAAKATTRIACSPLPVAKPLISISLGREFSLNYWMSTDGDCRSGVTLVFEAPHERSV